MMRCTPHHGIVEILGILLLSCCGCVYIPVPLKPVVRGEPIMPDLLGDSRSGHSLHVGSSKAAVLKILRTPLRQSSDGKKLAFGFAYVRGYWVGLMIRIEDSRNPPPPFYETRYRSYAAVLKFDGGDNLQSYQINFDDQTGGMINPISVNEMMSCESDGN